jgi:glycosyltransferase involved in cell wall biosynthesis
MVRALEEHCGEVVVIGPLQPVSLRIGKLISRVVHRITGRPYLYAHTASLSRRLGRMAEEGLKSANCDVIFASAASTVVAGLKTLVPIVYLSDATVRLMIDYYPAFSGLLPSQIRAADQIELLGIGKAAELIYPSSWAARSAIDDYHADASRVHVVPFGANLDEPPSREEVLPAPPKGLCRLLFVGVDWEQKGGSIAFETLIQLERLGVPAELTVVGCKPPDEITHPRLHVFRFLDKNDPGQRAQLNQLYREANFFILPTRAECFGIALCEANAYALPVLSTRTGGVPEFVREGVNGFLLEPHDRGDKYAESIRRAYADDEAYQTLRGSSRKEFEMRLNWDAWGMQVRDILSAAVSSRRAPLMQQ